MCRACSGGGFGTTVKPSFRPAHSTTVFIQGGAALSRGASFPQASEELMSRSNSDKLVEAAIAALLDVLRREPNHLLAPTNLEASAAGVAQMAVRPHIEGVRQEQTMNVWNWRFLFTMAAVLPMAACQIDRGPGQNESALLALTPSRACVSDLPFFGHYQLLDGGDGLGVIYAPAQGSISMSNDGGWCAIRHAYYFNTSLIAPELRVSVAPTHGEVLVGSVGRMLRIAYRPTRGYVGPDGFELRMGGPDPFTIPVRVAVLE